MYENADPAFVGWACGWFKDMFCGQYKDYLPIDVPYHDREHTMQGLLCMVRLLRGRHRAGAEPLIPRKTFELGILAILLHDTGYLKHRSDTSGTGAKYTLIHVTRSCEFAKSFLEEQGYEAGDITAVQNMIQCTSVNLSIADIAFSTPVEHVSGCALATADLLGQMSADDYVERLPQLYMEFKESYEHFGQRASGLYYTGPDELIANTPEFWHSYVKPKLAESCDSLYRFLTDPYPDGVNEYLKRVTANVEKAARHASD